MSNIQIKRTVRIITVEQPTATIIAAVLFEIHNGKMVAVAEPRVLKIIQKNQLALPGTITSKNFNLPQPRVSSEHLFSKIQSPYIPVFGYTNSHLITWLGARPPNNS